VNRNRSKKTFFTIAGTLISSCPMRTPASSVPTTVPSENDAEPEPADEEAHGQGEEDGQLLMLPQGRDERFHGGPGYFFGARFEASKASR
jgi:hypothetical protein